MKELLKLYVQNKKDITKSQFDYIKNDEYLLLYYLAVGNLRYINYFFLKQFVNSLNENKQKYLIKRQSEFITYIDNPSEQVQLAAVQKSLEAFSLIEKPYPSVINYVKSLKK